MLAKVDFSAYVSLLNFDWLALKFKVDVVPTLVPNSSMDWGVAFCEISQGEL
jgi:hypothetical protein